MDKKIGVYRIINLINDKVYIGSSFNFDARLKTHLYLLKSNRHYNTYLQNAWNKYGKDNFKFELIESILINNEKYLIEREGYWINYYKSFENKFGYNLDKIVSSGDKTRSEETKKKISKSKKGKYTGINNGFFGKHHNREQREKWSKMDSRKFIGEKNYFYGKSFKGENHPQANFTFKQVSDIREKYKTGNYTQKQIAKEYNVCPTSIGDIVRYKRYLPNLLLLHLGAGKRIVKGMINSQSSFFIAPDGSKEGWETSQECDEMREQFAEWLKEKGRRCEYVEVRFGGDDDDDYIVD